MHHAYYIEGPLSQFEAYKAHLRPLWAHTYERFGIDEAREIIALSSLKNFAEATFFIGASSITSEAQQALLKLLEEPQEGTTFVLLVPHGALLPTVQSRMLPYPEIIAEFSRSDLLVEKFLKRGGKERSDYIAEMLKNEDGLRERVRDFINALEAECVKLHFTQKVEGRQALEDIAMVRGYLSDRSPSLKILLEHLALSLPVI
ncbi:hypothetical protein A3D70_00835 [Candidatus Adlerbacteria bacterium RIFCSPHIGHO2_02_FULL_54_18]|uniref:Uncharacterized protein n=2 Tax=Candidatus Adleribacteriota TaxID=1752736 RepID=A0A1F4Y238_9BACT|nr:MAG: hypothetical protein A2949_01470 [Candidatus Adlerbacteria bacterium RIFCSPLOWO2_01_FULL_54_21b]OGC87924.1 MAG: hypothetical protein A3D70_00835 [Candidatus Adlerbacteria bacterium RIFCSPHIGHO2_02_FULL_54_18]